MTSSVPLTNSHCQSINNIFIDLFAVTNNAKFPGYTNVFNYFNHILLVYTCEPVTTVTLYSRAENCNGK